MLRSDKLKIALVTGWSMPASIWQNQLEEFGRSYHTLAVDPRGQGESQVPADGFTAERRASDLKEFLDPLKNVLLVGWSLGAIESLQYVHMFGADRLAGMVLVDSSVGEEPAPAPDGAFLQALRDDRDKTLDGFVRAIFKSARSDAEVAQLVAGAKRMSVEQSIALLSYPFPAHAIGKRSLTPSRNRCSTSSRRSSRRRRTIFRKTARAQRWKSSRTPATPCLSTSRNGSTRWC